MSIAIKDTLWKISKDTPYVNYNTQISFSCIECGFQKDMTPRESKLRKCPDCKRDEKLKKFIKDSSFIHNDKYSYSKSIFTKRNKNIIITCPKHGDFPQIAGSHLSGSGCKYCKNEKAGSSPKTTEQFIKEAVEVHGDEYTYKNTSYIYSYENVTITCPKHGDFPQIATNHLKGSKCRKCSDEKTAKQRYGGRPTYLYYIEIKHYKTTQYKIGVCLKHKNHSNITDSVRHRYPKEFKNKNISIKILNYDYNDDGYLMFLKEQSVLLNSGDIIQRDQQILESGYTETFHKDIFTK